jgi:uncharacterized protein (DUF1501 family)
MTIHQASASNGLTRRSLLLGSGALFAWAHLPKAALAEGRDPRLLVVVLRGALDGLGVVAPVGDPSWQSLRGEQALSLDGKVQALPLDSFFALNASMPELHRLYRAKQALFVHATATQYRERSHFDGQDILEGGLDKPGTADSGWLNRALAGLTPGGRVQTREAFAVGPMTPLIVRGRAPILSWTPRRLPDITDDTVLRLVDLYQHTDPKLARVLEERMGVEAMAGGMDRSIRKSRRSAKQSTVEKVRGHFAEPASAAAKFMSREDGPRIGALTYDGWDTHADEGANGGRLTIRLAALDGAIAAIESGMGKAWQETVVVVVTEFGRTARINGTAGTDHGTATMAILAGGALKGGRVLADWPGLKEAQLYEGRDLKPTTDLRAVLKGLLRDHLRLPERTLATTVFPGSGEVRPMDGLTTA